MFKVKLTILLINFLVVSTICDDSIIVPVENKEGNPDCGDSNGIPDHVRLAEQLNIPNYLRGCLDEKLNLSALRNAIDEAETEENISEIIKNACLEKESLFECMAKEFNGPIDQCTPDIVHAFRASQLSQSRNLLTHFCSDDGIKVSNFIKDSGISCLNEKKEQLSNCSIPINEKLNSNNSNNLKTIEENCKEFKTAHTCIVEVLQSCEKQTAATFFDEYLNLMFEGYICKDIAEPVM